MSKTLLYAPDLHPKTDDERKTGPDPVTCGRLAVGWDLTLAVSVVNHQAQVWSFDGSGNPLACLLTIDAGDRTPAAQLLAMCVPLAERFHPSHVKPAAGYTYGLEA